MAIFIHLANLIIDKFKIDLEKVKKGLNFGVAEYDQEDPYLLSFASLNANEFSEDDFEKLGLTEENYVIVSRYGGKYWDADWLEIFVDYAWHKLEDDQMKPRTKELDDMSIDEFLEKYETPLRYLEIINQP